MIDWLAGIFSKAVATLLYIFTNPVYCEADDLLMTFNLFLGGFWLGKIILHHFAVFRLKKTHARFNDSEYGDFLLRCRAVADSLGLKRLPQMFTFENRFPFVFVTGFLKPALFLSPTLLNHLDEKEQQALLVHEMTHVKRKDNLYIWILDSLLIFLPAIVVQVAAVGYVHYAQNALFQTHHAWWTIGLALLVLISLRRILWQKILFWRELSCDDVAVVITREPLTLASSIVNVWKLSQQLPVYRWRGNFALSRGFMGTSKNVEYRIRRLLDYRIPRFKFFFGKMMRLMLLGTTAFFLLLSAFLYSYSADKINDNLSAMKKVCPQESSPLPPAETPCKRSCGENRSAS